MVPQTFRTLLTFANTAKKAIRNLGRPTHFNRSVKPHPILHQLTDRLKYIDSQ